MPSTDHADTPAQGSPQIFCKYCKSAQAASIVGGIQSISLWPRCFLWVTQTLALSFWVFAEAILPWWRRESSWEKKKKKPVLTQEGDHMNYVWKKRIKNFHSQHLMKNIFFFPPILPLRQFSQKCQFSIFFFLWVYWRAEKSIFSSIKP